MQPTLYIARLFSLKGGRGVTTRLKVDHSVSEMITSKELVELHANIIATVSKENRTAFSKYIPA